MKKYNRDYIISDENCARLESGEIKVKCQWMENNRILVNPDGGVLPCCYLGNNEYRTQFEDWRVGHLMNEYKKNAHDLNIKNKPLEEIVEHEWFTKTLPESWKNAENVAEQCIRFCLFDEEK